MGPPGKRLRDKLYQQILRDAQPVLRGRAHVVDRRDVLCERDRGDGRQFVVQSLATQRRLGSWAANDRRRDASEGDANVANDLAVELRRPRKADLGNRLGPARANLSV